MIIVRSADKTVVGYVHKLPKILHAALAQHYIVHKLLRRNARGLCFFLYLLAMFIGSGKEHHVIALHPLIPRDNVRRHGAVRMTYMQLRAGIIDRCCDIKLFLCFHGIFPPWTQAHGKPFYNIYRKSKLSPRFCQ